MTNTNATQKPAAAQRRISPLAITIVIVVVLILAFLGAASVIGEVLWYQQLGYQSVLFTQWIAAGSMFLIGFFAMAIPVFFSIDIAYRKRPVYARLTAQLDRYQEVFEPLRKLVKWVLPATFGLFAGATLASGWQNVLLWLNSSPSGEKDPQFGLDVSFYLFDLPFWQGLVGFASAVLLISIIVGLATSYLYGGIAISERNVRISKATRIQAAVLIVLYLLVQAVSLWLDQYRLLGDSEGLLTGAMYSDVHAWVVAVPLAFITVVTVTGSLYKIFSPVPAVGYFANHVKYRDALAAGDTSLGTPEAMSAIVRNTMVQGVLSVLFLVLALIVIASAIVAVVRSYRLGKVVDTEDPYVPSQTFGPAGFIATPEERKLQAEWEALPDAELRKLAKH